MPTPGPDHPITLEPATRRWRAYFNHHVIADTADALILREAGLPPVIYFPRADVATEYFGRTGRRTHCPYKGDASHYTLTMDGEILENVAWSYEDPKEAMSGIGARIAFYPGEVEIYEIDDAVVNPQHHRRERAEPVERVERAEPAVVTTSERDEIAEIVQHTDAGCGISQREHWAPNVETPGQPEGGLR